MPGVFLPGAARRRAEAGGPAFVSHPRREVVVLVPIRLLVPVLLPSSYASSSSEKYRPALRRILRAAPPRCLDATDPDPSHHAPRVCPDDDDDDDRRVAPGHDLATSVAVTASSLRRGRTR